jgi:3-hydroxyacyl-CoA dehydrogenase
MNIAVVGIAGLGTMGAGIAEVFARHGYQIVGVERDEPSLERGRRIITRSLQRALERGRISQEDLDATIARITFTTERGDLANADLIVEAIPEVMEFKRELFAALDQIVKADVILATNTSSLSVTEIASLTTRSTLGLHFFNPAPVQPLVEVITHDGLDSQVVEEVTALVREIGKKPVVVADQAGFLVNALLVPYLNHAAHFLGRDDLAAEDLDAAMVTLGFAPMGPAALLDLIGLDTALEVTRVLQAAFGRPDLEPAPRLVTLVEQGRLGRKSGSGFYDYSAPLPAVDVPSPVAQQAAIDLHVRFLNDAVRMFSSGYASKEDIDLGMVAGCGYRVGPFEAISERGPQQVISDLTDAYSRTGDEMDLPRPYLLEAANS